MRAQTLRLVSKKCSDSLRKPVMTHITEARKKPQTKIEKQTGTFTNLVWGKIISRGLTQVQTHDLYMSV